MRRNRLIYLLAWILSIVGISFYGGVLSYGIFWALTLLPVILLIYLVFVLFGFKIYQQVGVGTIVSRSPVPYYFTLQNESIFAFSSVKVTFYEFGVDYGDLNQDEEYELMPHDGARVNTNIVCKYRGKYEIGVKNIIICDFLKLFRITYKNHEPLLVTVLPAIEFPEKEEIEKQALFTNSSNNPDKNQRDILVRPYIFGDSIKSINWKVTAKSRKLMVSNEISEEHNSINIIVDTKRYYKEKENYLPKEDELLTNLITLVIYLAKHHVNISVHFYSDGYKTFVLNDMNSFDHFYTVVSQIVFDSKNDMELTLSEISRSVDINNEDTIILRNRGMVQEVAE